MMACHVALPALACLIMAACTTPKPAPEPPARPANPLLEADLSSWRMEGKEQTSLPGGQTVQTNRLTKLADGSWTASGQVYVKGAEPLPGQDGEWPLHAYADEATWTASTQTLELRGWPVLEYHKRRHAAMSADTTITLAGGTARSNGPMAIRLEGNATGMSKSTR